ncbi:MAG: HAMP domain-containing sensor histidine kinase [Dethiobacteria bacterium]|jgi:signal transduction histidine kinase|nr:HAMP domain-containing sensor histidine kinase [Bacillota bacterium]
MRRAVVKGAVAFIVSFLLLSLATAFAFEEAEHILSLFAGAALSSYSAKDAPGATETDLAVILKERPDELMANGARFLRYYGYLPGASYTNRHKPLWMNLALALFAGLLASFQSARGEKKLKRELLKLSDYLRALHRGEDKLVLRDDLFGQLRDDIYKTVLILRESREKALADRALLKRNIEDITHQIKTPLTTIRLMLDLITQDEANQTEHIARLDEEIDRLNRLTSALLKLSSLDAGAIAFRSERFNAESMIYEAIQPIEGLIQQKQVELRLAGQDYEIKGDRSWLMEAFLNLVKNAVEAVDDRGIVEIRLSENDIYKSMAVRDNGPGIAADDMRHIFDRFFKTQNAQKESFGIGLSMAKSIVEGHGGSLEVESTSTGSCFEIRFYPQLAVAGADASI